MLSIRQTALFLSNLGLFISISFAGKLYVSSSGNDTTGSMNNIDLPFRTIPRAINAAARGDTVYVRGGVHIINSQISLATSGLDTTFKNYLIAYPGERPVLDFSSMGIPGVSGSADGIRLTGNYWYIKGLDIKGAPHNGIQINGGNNNIIEFCAIYENRNTGLQISSGASYNKIINCDSYFNRDSSNATSYDGNADGFAPKLDNGTHNYFYGCRAWQNSDDGWDGYVRPAAPVAGKDTMRTIIENCWSFSNGYLKNGTAGKGNGNGFKLGGGDKDSSGTVSNKDSLRHNMTLRNCLAFMNLKKGFDQNNNRGTMTLINCTGFENGTYNYSFPGYIRTGEVLTIENCISYLSQGITISGVIEPVLVTNSWQNTPPYVSTAVAADFLSIDTAGVCNPRKSDGSLPDISFMHLGPGSQFINTGTDAGLTYYGSLPDLGCFESNYSTNVNVKNENRKIDYWQLKNYPNPFNPSTVIVYRLQAASKISLKVYDILGREIITLADEMQSAGEHRIVWKGRNVNGKKVGSGVYFCRLITTAGFTNILKMIVIE